MPENNPALYEAFYRQRSEEEKQIKLQRYRHLNRFVCKGQVVFAGSSLMEQFPVYEFLFRDPMPYPIYNRGIGGFTTTELLKALEPCIFELEPAHLFLNIGTNDLNSPDYDKAVLLEQYAQILQAVQERLPHASVYLLAYYPVNPSAAQQPYLQEIFRHRTNERIAEANKGVRALATRFGAAFLDLNKGLFDAQGNLEARFTVDGMHMYAEGYTVVWKNLRPLLKSLRPHDLV